jgi:hypothetical protein
MANKATVINAENVFIVQKGDKKESFEGHKGMESATAVRAILNAVKGAGTLQDAHQTMLHHVLNRPLMDSIKGKGDTKTGKVDPAAKALVRQSEVACINEWFASGIKGIPSDEAERIKLAESIRVDGNYSNIKVTCLRYLAFCGKYPMTNAGYLVPKAVMQAEISAALNKTEPDNSLYAQLMDIKKHLDGEDMLAEADARKSEPLAREIASVLKGILAHYDELLTNSAQNLPVNAGLPGAMTEIRGKMMRAPAPGTDKVHDTALM